MISHKLFDYDIEYKDFVLKPLENAYKIRNYFGNKKH